MNLNELRLSWRLMSQDETRFVLDDAWNPDLLGYVYFLPKSSSWTSHDTSGCYVGWSNQTTSATCATRPSRAALVLGLEGFLAARVGDSNWLPSPEALGWLSSVLSRLTVVREFCLGSIHCASVYFQKKKQVETNFSNWGSQSLFAETMVSGFFILKNVKPKKLRQGSSLWTAKDSKTSGKPLGDATHGTWKLWMITMVDSALIWNYYTMICILYSLWTYIRPWKITTIRWMFVDLGARKQQLVLGCLGQPHHEKSVGAPTFLHIQGSKPSISVGYGSHLGPPQHWVHQTKKMILQISTKQILICSSFGCGWNAPSILVKHH